MCVFILDYIKNNSKVGADVAKWIKAVDCEFTIAGSIPVVRPLCPGPSYYDFFFRLCIKLLYFS